MVEFPLGVFGIALATVILPSLSREHATASRERFSATLDWALRWVLLIATPAMLGLLLLAAPILATLFQQGGFTGTDVHMASLSLMAYALGLPGFILVKVLAPGFFARQDTRTPVRIGVIAMLANMGLNVLFVVPLVWWQYEAPHAGLALATAASSYINAGLLWRGLLRQGVYQPLPGWSRLALQVSVASLALAVVVLVLSPGLPAWLEWHWYERAWRLALAVLGGALVYLVMLLLLGVRPRQLLGRQPEGQ
jgi:putative peptidoglycan lipid II flippase